MSLVTLTFDNGPCPKTTPGVLRQLRELNLQAWFCLVGLQLIKGQEQIDIARETLAHGHTLVNHSFTHRVALGDECSRSHAQHEVRDAHQLLCEKLGAWGEPWFRPFGRGGEISQHLLSEAALSELEALKYSVLLWNSVPRDWEDVDGWVETALVHVAARKHTVLVLHDLDTGAMQHLERFLHACLARGDVFTRELPEDCVPMREGARGWEERRFASLIAA